MDSESRTELAWAGPRGLRRLARIAGVFVAAGAVTSGCGLPRYVADTRGIRPSTGFAGDAAPAQQRDVDPLLLTRPARGCPPPRTMRAPDVKPKRVALTFDDGPTPGITEEVLQILREEGVHATFFNIGTLSQRHPDLERSISREGHTIGSHGFDHTRYTELSLIEVRRQTDASARAIVANTGRPVCFVRPPYGALNSGVAASLARGGYSTVLWNADSRDWAESDPDVVVASALAGVNGGPVTLLMHSTAGIAASDGTADPSTGARPAVLLALSKVIRRYKAMGYRFVQVDGSSFPPVTPALSPQDEAVAPPSR